MAKTEKEQAHSAEEKQEAISIETAKVIQGISLVFSGAVTMLEALHPHVSLEPSAILHLVTGNIEGLEAMAAEKRAKEEQENAETKDAGRTGVEGAVPSSPAADSASVDDGASAEVVFQRTERKLPELRKRQVPSRRMTSQESSCRRSSRTDPTMKRSARS